MKPFAFVQLFGVEDEEKKTWSEALNFCRELGGDLLSIHSDFDLLQNVNT